MAKLTEEQKKAIKEARAQAQQNEMKEEDTMENNNINEGTTAQEEAKVTTEPPVAVLLSSGKWALGPTTTITCQDCGAPRTIKIQDAFQVTRCTACQKKAANKKRAAKMKAKHQAASLERRTAEAMELLKSLGLTVTKED